MLWDPLALAALNQPPDQAAAPLFARVLAEMFGADPRAAAIALPTKPLHQMYAEPARAYIEAPRRRRCGPARPRRVAIDGGRASPASTAAARRWTPRARHLRRAVVRARRRCSTATPPALRDDRSRARARWPSSPIVTVNLWFDRPVLDEPFVGLPGRAMQWVFDKRLVFGDDGVAPVAGLERRRRRSSPRRTTR